MIYLCSNFCSMIYLYSNFRGHRAGGVQSERRSWPRLRAIPRRHFDPFPGMPFQRKLPNTWIMLVIVELCVVVFVVTSICVVMYVCSNFIFQVRRPLRIPNRAYPSRGGPIRPEAGLSVPRRIFLSQSGMTLVVRIVSIVSILLNASDRSLSAPRRAYPSRGRPVTHSSHE